MKMLNSHRLENHFFKLILNICCVFRDTPPWAAGFRAHSPPSHCGTTLKVPRSTDIPPHMNPRPRLGQQSLPWVCPPAGRAHLTTAHKTQPRWPSENGCSQGRTELRSLVGSPDTGVEVEASPSGSIIANKSKQPKYPPIHKWVNK